MDKTILTVRIKSDGYYETAFEATEEETFGAVFSAFVSAISQFKKFGADENVVFCMIEDILEHKGEFIALAEEIG